ncbi:MAG: ribonuclease HI family protein [Candidatus Acetothermia bacterium]|jgi:ribonuclease HI|nr:ribonuclease HI family protein [Candidatus Acetothermia bacterium]MDH7505730.1 ribonuclease HI family protein [Candidatus Acetothermia bacterium]
MGERDLALEKLLVNVDGSAEGNPGEAAIGVVITDRQGNVMQEISESIGRATNNIAEYKALITACKAALEYRPREVIFFTDSQLVANQINGLYRIRQPNLEKLNSDALALLRQFPVWQVRYVERTANWRAHKLAQQAIFNRNPSRERDLTELIRERLEKLDEDGKRKVLEYVTRLIESQER